MKKLFSSVLLTSAMIASMFVSADYCNDEYGPDSSCAKAEAGVCLSTVVLCPFVLGGCNKKLNNCLAACANRGYCGPLEPN